MSIMVNPKHIRRYGDIARLLIRHGRSDVVKSAGMITDLEPDAASDTTAADATTFATDLEELGPTFVKLGQVLSTRPDLLPPPYIMALSRLQDKIEPFSYEEVEKIVAEELGIRISKAFSDFEKKPIGSASLGQVHRATLRDGRIVVVKVQRPGVREQVASDLEVLEEIASFLDSHTSWGDRYEFCRTLEEFRRSIWRELDYLREARNLTALANNMEEFPNIIVPTPIEDYTSSRVLTMEYIRGKKITDMGPLASLELDGGALAEEIFEAYLKQILVDGYFHADPHPGNVFLTNDRRIALLDLGMVGYVAPTLQENLLQLVLAVSEGRGDDAATLSIKISSPKKDFDEVTFRQNIANLVSENFGSRVEDIQAGRIMLEMGRISGESKLRVPSELSMLGKTLLNLDVIARTLDPTFDPNASIRSNANKLLTARLRRSFSPGNIFGGLLEVKDLIARMPDRVNRIMDAVATNNLKVKVDAIDEELLVEGFQKVANRITLGLILAALIVGAALLMRVETTFRLFGYPGFAIVCFMVAAGSGMIMVVRIVLQDRRSKKMRR
ncbi:MAG: AarF/ABC1/UbiB kinase family protein [Candidatus Hydrogenedentes bacterium]|nr:AarF/ABC1/UbiB kinase family protein [Candidatus Hydrogenedentota bacterium]